MANVNLIDSDTIEIEQTNNNIQMNIADGVIPEVKTTTTTSDTDTYSCNYVNNKITRTDLWTNPNPTSSFSGNITLSSGNYDYLEIIFITLSSRGTYQTNIVYNIGTKGELYSIFNYNGSMYAGTRYFTFLSSTILSFEDCYGMDIKNDTGYTTHADWLVPYKVIGHKYNQ